MKRLSKGTIKRYNPDQLARHIDRYMSHFGIDIFRINLATREVFERYWRGKEDQHAYLFHFNYGPSNRSALGNRKHAAMVEVLREVYAMAYDKTL